MENIKSISIQDYNYPEELKQISNPPKMVYYRGQLFKANSPRIAIVGTRRPSDYGRQVTIKITEELVDAGIIIISGMAPGIDTLAHQICTDKKTRTIAVLGTGLDEKSIYPSSNIRLSRDIIANGGCLISEFAPGTPGYPNNFRQRNRIVSALSKGVIIIEAKERSGSLITARFSREQNKKLFAVPGPIFSLNSQGTNGLIKNGAILIESAKDVLRQLNISPIKKQGILTGENQIENRILNALNEGALCIDQIIETTKLDPSAIAAALAFMEISGKIRNLGGNTYSK